MLQRQVEDLDQLKARHYAEILEHEEEVWDVVQGKVPTFAAYFPRDKCPRTIYFSDLTRGPFDARRIR